MKSFNNLYLLDTFKTISKKYRTKYRKIQTLAINQTKTCINNMYSGEDPRNHQLMQSLPSKPTMVKDRDILVT